MFDRCEAARRLFIAVPTYTGMFNYDTALSIIHATPLLMHAGIDVMCQSVEGLCYVDSARNELIQSFLETDATDLLFLDADVGFHPETLVKLAKATRPMIAAIYPKKTDDEEYPVEFARGTHTMHEEGWIEANVVPTGLLRINRRVFTELAPSVKRYKGKSGREMSAFFFTSIREAYYGEDVEFCRIWREAGGKIRILPDEELSHTGNKAWIGNVGKALRAGKF